MDAVSYQGKGLRTVKSRGFCEVDKGPFKTFENCRELRDDIPFLDGLGAIDNR